MLCYVIGNVNLAITNEYNWDDVIRNYMGIYKVLLLSNECGDPPFLFQNVSSYKVNNQSAKFDKNISAGSISDRPSIYLPKLRGYEKGEGE